MDKIYKLSDKYSHDVSTELISIHFYHLCKDLNIDKKLLAKVVTVMASKLNQDNKSYSSLSRIKRKYKYCYDIEKDILLTIPLTLPPLLFHLNTNKPLPTACRYLLRLVGHNVNLKTFLLAVKIARDTPLVSNIIKYAKLYQFFKVLSFDIDVHISHIIWLYNRVKND